MRVHHRSMPQAFRAIATMLCLIAGGVVTAAPPEVAVSATSTHWSLQPIVDYAPPPLIAGSDWPANAIDAFVLAAMREKGLTPSPDADRVTLIRRLYLVMHGLPPTPAEVAAFVADDSPDAWANLVEGVLSSPRYGEAWAQHWLDVVRYADTHGFEVNTPRSDAWPYRDWVITALNDDMPYDRFMFAQVAGDTIHADAATGMLVAGPAVRPGQVGKDEASIKSARQDALDEIIKGVGGAFMGLTVSCAKCHDHKFDPITQLDYYRMQAIFAGVDYESRPLRSADQVARETERSRVGRRIEALQRRLDESAPLASPGTADAAASRDPVTAKRNIERFSPVEARFVRFTIEATNNGNNPCIDELEVWAGERNLALASLGVKATASGTYPNSAKHRLDHINDGQHGNSRSWISDERGRGWVQLEFPDTVTIDRITWGRDREGEYDDRVPMTYSIEVSPSGEAGSWRTIADSTDRLPMGSPPVAASPEATELAELHERFNALAAENQTVFAGVFNEPHAIHLLYRGDAMSPREAVGPDVPAILGSLDLPADAGETQRRAAFGRWLASPANPLTPRVIINRLWQHHFGSPLVDTPNDFGGNGVAPTHPMLLDYLAARLVKHGWSLKHIHRLILHSRTFRQSSLARSDAVIVDAQTRLLWRYPGRRLAAEPIRDSMLHVAGVLELTMGGPGYSMFLPNNNYVRNYEPKEQWGPAEFRRMIYAHKVRMEVAPVVGAFDCPDAGQTQPRRARSTTAIQALNLFNSSFTMTVAGHFADRVQREAGGELSDQVAHAFTLALGRPPTDTERADAIAFVAEHGLAALARVLLNTNEFLFIP